ncbi:hypothetical protein VN24_12375 [Paenibacillus beijingensis]|uniref:Uncharacterized protein n=1 Tax=Paenibacillus beijingensis TaxID=1126833 RepID=A0A0D5NJY0_9BACL|nr:hypothetical protein VN24_12375 [Paenibacillus beijingensis]
MNDFSHFAINIQMKSPATTIFFGSSGRKASYAPAAVIVMLISFVPGEPLFMSAVHAAIKQRSLRIPLWSEVVSRCANGFLPSFNGPTMN